MYWPIRTDPEIERSLVVGPKVIVVFQYRQPPQSGVQSAFTLKL
jgi:hypothetical protein